MSSLDQIISSFISFLPTLIAALVVLLVGWIIARWLGGVVTRLLKRTNADQRLSKLMDQKEGQSLTIADWVGKAVYYILLLLVLIAFFQILGLTLVNQPITTFLLQIFSYLPSILAGIALILVVYIIARITRGIVRAGLRAIRLDDRFGANVGSTPGNVSPTNALGEVAFYLIWLLFLPGILAAFGLQAVLLPFQQMIDELLSIVPNLISAGVILLVGYFVFRLVRQIVAGLLVAVGLDRLGERVGINKYMGKQTLSSIFGLIAGIVVFIPIATAALSALGIESLTAPLSKMMSDLLTWGLQLAAATVLVFIAYIVARIVGDLVTSILTGLGFDNILQKLGVGEQPNLGGTSPSRFIGNVILVVILWLAAIAAFNTVGLPEIGTALSTVLQLAYQIALGLLILAIGLWLAKVFGDMIAHSGINGSRFLALIARIGIIALAAVMGLSQTGLASEIINWGFVVILAAVAGAVALSFGLGGREVAGRYWEDWSAGISKQIAEPPPPAPPAEPEIKS